MPRLGVNMLVLKKGAVGVMYVLYIYNVYIYIVNIYAERVFGGFNKLLAGLGWWGVSSNQARGFTWFFFGPKDVQRNRRLKWRFSAFLHIPSILLSHPHIFVTWHHVGCANTLCSPSTRWLFGTWKRIMSRRVKTHYYFSGKMLIIVGWMIRHFQRWRCLLCNLTWFSSRRSTPHVLPPLLHCPACHVCLKETIECLGGTDAQIWKVDLNKWYASPCFTIFYCLVGSNIIYFHRY